MGDPHYDTLIRIELQQETMSVDIASIKTKVDALPCGVNTYKIGLLQRIVYGAVAIVLLAFMANIISPKAVSKATSVIEQKVNG